MAFLRSLPVLLVAYWPVANARRDDEDLAHVLSTVMESGVSNQLDARITKSSMDFLATMQNSSSADCITQLEFATDEGETNTVTGEWNGQFEFLVPFQCPAYTYNDAKHCLSNKNTEWPSFSGPANYISAGAGGFTVRVQHGNLIKVAKSTADAESAYSECVTLKRLEFHNVPNVVRCEALCVHGILHKEGHEKQRLFTFVISPYVAGAFQCFTGNRIDGELTGGTKTRKSLTFNGPTPQDKVWQDLLDTGSGAMHASEFEMIDSEGNRRVISYSSVMWSMKPNLSYPVTLSFEMPESVRLDEIAIAKAAESTLETGFKILQANVVNLDLHQNILYTKSGDVVFIDFGKVSGMINSSQANYAQRFVCAILTMLPKSWWADDCEKATTLAYRVLDRCHGPWTDLIKDTIGTSRDSCSGIQ